MSSQSNTDTLSNTDVLSNTDAPSISTSTSTSKSSSLYHESSSTEQQPTSLKDNLLKIFPFIKGIKVGVNSKKPLNVNKNCEFESPLTLPNYPKSNFLYPNKPGERKRCCMRNNSGTEHKIHLMGISAESKIVRKDYSEGFIKKSDVTFFSSHSLVPHSSTLRESASSQTENVLLSAEEVPLKENTIKGSSSPQEEFLVSTQESVFPINETISETSDCLGSSFITGNDDRQSTSSALSINVRCDELCVDLKQS